MTYKKCILSRLLYKTQFFKKSRELGLFETLCPLSTPARVPKLCLKKDKFEEACSIEVQLCISRLKIPFECNENAWEQYKYHEHVTFITIIPFPYQISYLKLTEFISKNYTQQKGNERLLVG